MIFSFRDSQYKYYIKWLHTLGNHAGGFHILRNGIRSELRRGHRKIIHSTSKSVFIKNIAMTNIIIGFTIFAPPRWKQRVPM